MSRRKKSPRRRPAPSPSLVSHAIQSDPVAEDLLIERGWVPLIHDDGSLGFSWQSGNLFDGSSHTQIAQESGGFVVFHPRVPTMERGPSRMAEG